MPALAPPALGLSFPTCRLGRHWDPTPPREWRPSGPHPRQPQPARGVLLTPVACHLGGPRTRPVHLLPRRGHMVLGAAPSSPRVAVPLHAPESTQQGGIAPSLVTSPHQPGCWSNAESWAPDVSVLSITPSLSLASIPRDCREREPQTCWGLRAPTAHTGAQPGSSAWNTHRKAVPTLG